jgi:NAD(P)-dependent dehydrogenase (short-subunit alcohol dehydrogenase family)
MLWKQALQWKKSIDVLVNNAGIMIPLALESSDNIWHSDWNKTLQVNLIAAADLCRKAIAHFQKRGGGIIINIASRAAFRGSTKEYMHYAASKAGLVALSRTIARDFAKDKIYSYTIAP